jgi:hypothetical protein
MTKQSLRSVALLVALCFLAVGMASAGSYTVPFPAAGDAYYSSTYGGGTIPSGGQTDFLFDAGDYVLSPVFNLGSAAIVGLSATFQYQDFLGNGNTETWFLYLNGVQVGSAILPDDGYNGDILTLKLSSMFAPITPVAGGYQLELVEQNTVPFGGGSVAWLDGGTAQLVPEPGSMALIGTSLVALGGLLYRKTKHASVPQG